MRCSSFSLTAMVLWTAVAGVLASSGSGISAGMGASAGLQTARENQVRQNIDARMMQMPAVSATQIAFCYAGDIWIVAKGGGVATRLSSPRGSESFPRFSPDGTQLAFTANYEGNDDIYVMPTVGGEPRRLTHHGAAERVLGWYPDGRSILFASRMTSFTDRVGQFFRVAAEGGLPERLPIAYGEFAAISPDGNRLAFTTSTTDFATWKRYRGGMASEIYLFDLAQKAAVNVTANEAVDSQPMWHGDTLYFVSDRDAAKRRNIWALDTVRGTNRQVTFFTDADVHFPSIGPADIVFEAKGRLYLLDLAKERLREAPVQVITDLATIRPRSENVAQHLQNAAISPTGRRALFEARGDIFSVPEEGIVRNLTASPGVAERYPAWSPDGRYVAYFSDRSGEYELTVRAANGRGAEQQLTNLGPGWRYRPQWSPDGKKIAFIDATMKIHLVDFEKRAGEVIDRQLWKYHGALEDFRVSWSADSRWLAYGRDQENRHSAIVLYDTRLAEQHTVTSGFYDDDLPVFDPDHRYLYYRSKRSNDPIYSESDNTWVYANSHVLVAVPLRKETISPLAPRNDEEPMRMPLESATPAIPRSEPPAPPARASDVSPVSYPMSGINIAVAEESRREETTPSPTVAMRAGEAPVKESPAVRASGGVPLSPAIPRNIDIEGFESRAEILPLGGGRYENLRAVSGRLIFTRQPRAGAGSATHLLCFYDFDRRDEYVILDDCAEAELSADGRRLLVSRGSAWGLIPVDGGQRLSSPLPVGAMEAIVDPQAEWRQIFQDAWRLERDFFYDRDMHGVDWAEMRERYLPLIDDCVTRGDLNYVLGEMLGELSASHVYRSGGDVDLGADRSVGYLGCDFALEQGAYRIARILEVAPWDYASRSPLRAPGVNAREGDWLLAVNGRPVDPAQSPWAAFQGLGGRTVQLTVNSKPTLDGAREVLVTTLADEARLRQQAWVEENRRLVEKATGGRVGYIYVGNTATDGQNELYRQFRAQFHKPALIIDERWNSGGQIPDRFIELLGRRVTNYWGVRDGHDWQTPFVAHHGPKVMLVNGWSGSGGDCLPWMFSKAGLGKVIGQRTWGGLVGMTGAPRLIDGGSVTVPTFGIYDPNGSWIIEGSGVEPDLAVLDDPAALARGEDPQLARAIAETLAGLETAPARATRPPGPNRAGMYQQVSASR